MSKLILVRHGKSDWNAKGLWTGWQDPPLINEGREDARRSAQYLKNFKIDQAFSSPLKRVTETLDIILQELKLTSLPITQDKALNERDYGIYTGKNKWQIKEEVGEEEFQKIRRGWDHPIPEGETMEVVYNRVVPFYQNSILSLLKSGQNVLVVSSGNALRALVKYLDNLDNHQLADLEFGIGEVYVYEIDGDGKVTSKEILSENPNRGKV